MNQEHVLTSSFSRPLLNLGARLNFNLISSRCSLDEGIKVTERDEWDELLLNVASTQCRTSFRKIFDHFFPLVTSQGIKGGLNKDISVELAQEALMKVWSSAHLFDSKKGKAAAWIYTISRNLRYDYFRGHKNDPLKLSSSDLYAFENDLNYEVDLEFLFDISILKNNMNHLPPEQADVLEKIYFQGLTHEEISQLQKIPLGTVKSRIRLAIAAIKMRLEGEAT